MIRWSVMVIMSTQNCCVPMEFQMFDVYMLSIGVLCTGPVHQLQMQYIWNSKWSMRSAHSSFSQIRKSEYARPELLRFLFNINIYEIKYIRNKIHNADSAPFCMHCSARSVHATLVRKTICLASICFNTTFQLLQMTKLHYMLYMLWGD